MRIKASDVARVCSGELVGTDVEATGVWFDTRTLGPGRAFVAVVAEGDGHDHLGDAIDRSASFAIVERGRSVPGITCVEVDDTIVALADLGSWCRDRLTCPIVAITGSAGKTSTKNMVEAVLSTAIDRVHAATGSLNNDIGLPITIINAPDDAGAVVVEMGMRGFGEIARLCRVARPTVGIVTNVGDAHGELVGGPDGIARAKAELPESIGAEGVVVLNSDDPRVDAMAAGLRARVVAVGHESDCDVRWRTVGAEPDGSVVIELTGAGTSARCSPSSPGEHMGANAALAVAAGLACGIGLDVAASGIGRESPEPGRMTWRSGRDGLRILDDSYNANVSSMTAALDTVAALDEPGCLAVLGRMTEVEDPEGSHRRVADHARSLGIGIVALETDLYGPAASSVEECVATVRDSGARVVVVKGSRTSRTERVVQALLS